MLWRIQEKLQTRRPSARMGKLLDADAERPKLTDARTKRRQHA
jgi:hypothetical protein